MDYNYFQIIIVNWGNELITCVGYLGIYQMWWDINTQWTVPSDLGYLFLIHISWRLRSGFKIPSFIAKNQQRCCFPTQCCVTHINSLRIIAEHAE